MKARWSEIWNVLRNVDIVRYWDFVTQCIETKCSANALRRWEAFRLWDFEVLRLDIIVKALHFDSNVEVLQASGVNAILTIEALQNSPLCIVPPLFSFQIIQKYFSYKNLSRNFSLYLCFPSKVIQSVCWFFDRFLCTFNWVLWLFYPRDNMTTEPFTLRA